MYKIVFFNHYHRGDIFTHREFIRHLTIQLPNVEFLYLHFNHPKLTRDLGIPCIGTPNHLDHHTKFYIDEDKKILYVNTWGGCDASIMNKNKGLNLHSLYDQWHEIFSFISNKLNQDIFVYADKEDYLPTIDFTYFDVTQIDQYLQSTVGKKRVLICNGAPKSGQSFLYNMESFIKEAADNFPIIDFICTQKFEKTQSNILFTDDLIGDTEAVDKRAPWEDKTLNICDLPEISYLSEHCDLIVGKNSGPSTFCETHANYMNPNKHFISYVVRWNSGNIDSESLSYNLKLECKYEKILIEHRDPLSEKDIITIRTSLNNALNLLS
jgi:hypothetical protein